MSRGTLGAALAHTSPHSAISDSSRRHGMEFEDTAACVPMPVRRDGGAAAAFSASALVVMGERELEDVAPPCRQKSSLIHVVARPPR